jgi:hypothetical protein
MKRVCKAALAFSMMVAFGITAVHGEVKIDRKTQVKFGGALGKMMGIFGGKAAKEGLTTTVAVKGDRKATISGDNVQIIDLAEEKVYDIDLKSRSYKVTTFDELRQEMEKARERAEKNAQRASQGDQKAPEMEMDFDVKDTGQTRTINGFNCRQFITTITIREKDKTLEQGGGMVLTSDSWLAPEVNAEKEIADFDLRYAQKLRSEAIGDAAQQMAQMMAMYPGAEQAMGKLRAETANMKGSAILTTSTFDSVPSKEQVARQQKQEQEQEGGGGLLGGFAKRLGRKKSDDQQQGATGKNTIMTSTSEVLRLSTAVSPEEISVPAGFKLKK